MLNPSPILLARSQILAALRAFFAAAAFKEVDTPIAIMANAPEMHIEPVPIAFKRDGELVKGFLHTSPELAMKRLLAKGFGNIYQLCHVFRDDEWTSQHHSEFMMLEWYRSQADIGYLFSDPENIIKAAAAAIGTSELKTARGTISLDKPFYRFTIDELFEKYVGFKVSTCAPDNLPMEHIYKLLGRRLPEMPFDDVFNLIMLEKIDPELEKLDRPYFVSHYPAPLASLSRLDPKNPLLSERVELYAADIELANGFVELTDAQEQRRRFAEEEAERRRRGKVAQPTDERFLKAVAEMPPATGMAMGFDRLVMLLTGARHIDEVTFIPPLGA